MARINIRIIIDDLEYNYAYAIDRRELRDAVITWRSREEAEMSRDPMQRALICQRIENARMLCRIVGDMAEKSFGSMLQKIGEKSP